MTPSLSIIHVIERLREARERVACGWPSVALALAGAPISTAQARIQEAEEAKYATSKQPWVLVLIEALAFVEEARKMWGTADDILPLMTADLAPCGVELRLHLPGARATSPLPWEDPGRLTRPQALCVVHLAVCLAQWRALEQRAEFLEEKRRRELEQERRENAASAAKSIWGGIPPPAESERESGPRSLRDLASVSAAFGQWDGDEEP